MALGDEGNEQTDPLLASLSADRAWTAPKKGEARTGYLEEQEARTAWAMDQAVSRGLMDQDDAEEAKLNKQRTWWDKMWGFEESSNNLLGGFAQPIVDVLSLANYATASMTQATMKDPLVQVGSLKVGFTPSAWMKEFAKRPSYGDVMESFGTGLAFDIAMDPMTYLSFGVSAGMKVGVQGLAKVGAKELAKGTNHLTMTRHGQAIYTLAATKLREPLEMALQREADDALAAGVDIQRLVGPETGVRLHQEIAKSMVDDYAELNMELEQKANRWQKFKDKANGVITPRQDYFNLKPEDMFRETASMQHRDVGVDFNKIGGFMTDEKHALGRYFKEVVPNFHRKFNVPIDVQNQWFLTKGTIERDVAKLQGEIVDGIGDLNPEQLRNATLALESGEARLIRSFGPDQKTMLGHLMDETGESHTLLDEKTLRAVDFGRKRFDEIVEAENLAGFKIDSIEDYVARVYKTPALQTLVTNKINGNKAINTLSNVSQKKSFRMHRVIASLDEAIGTIGEDAIEMNLGKILMRRQAQSVRMMEMEKFYDYLKLTSGITPTLVYQINKEGKRVAAAFKEILKSVDDQRIFDSDQVWALDDAYHVKAGLDTGPNKGAQGRNIDTLEFLGKSLADRQGLTASGLRNRVQPNSFADVTKEHDWGFSTRKLGEGETHQFDLIDVIKSEYEDIMGSDVMDFIAKASNIEKGQVSSANVKKFVQRLDKKLRDEVGASLNDLFPDFAERVIAKSQKGHHGKSYSLKAREADLDKWMDEVYTPNRDELLEAKSLAEEAGKGTSGLTKKIDDLEAELSGRQKKVLKHTEADNKIRKDLSSIANKKAKLQKSHDKWMDEVYNPGKAQRADLEERFPEQAIRPDDRSKIATLRGQSLPSSTVKKGSLDNQRKLRELNLEHAHKRLDGGRRVAGPVDSGRLGYETRVLKADADTQFTELRKSLNEKVPINEKYAPQIPKEVALRAKIARMRYGNFSDVSNPSAVQLSSLQSHADELGLKPEQLLDITEALLGKRSITDVSARGIDKLNEFLMIHLGKFDGVQGRSNGHLFNSKARKINTGTVATPKFPAAHESVQASIESFEALSRKELGRARKIRQHDGDAEIVAANLKALRNKLNEAVEMTKSTLTKEDLAKSMDHVKDIERKVAVVERDLERIAALKRKIPQEKFDLPSLRPDNRTHIKATEVVAANAAKLAPHEVKLFSSKTGAARIEISIGQLTGKASDKAKRARHRLQKKIRGLQDQSDLIKEKIVNGAEDLSVDELKVLAGEREAAEALIKEATDEAGTAFKKKTDIRILSDGRYMDEAGKVHDILVDRPKGGTPKILGKDAEGIKEALIEHSFEKGGNIKALQPALIGEVPDSIIGSAGGEYVMPASIVDFVEDVLTPLYAGNNKMIDRFFKGFDRVQNAFKVPLLAPWFSTFARNAIGNVSLGYLHAGLAMLDPVHLKDFTSTFQYILATEAPDYRKMKLALDPEFDNKAQVLGSQVIKHIGGEITIAELAEEFGKRGVFSSWMRSEVFETFPGGLKGEKAGGALAGAIVGSSVAGPYGGLAGAAVGMLLKKEAFRMRNLFRAQELGSEIPTRLMLGIHSLRETGSLDQAANTVRKYLHDYSELSVFERRFVRRAIPFYNFTKLAFRVFGEEVFEHPGRVMLPMKVFNNQNTSGMFSDTQALPEDVPDWFHKQMVFMGKDIDEDTGKVKSWVWSGLNLPLQEVLQLSDIVGPGGSPVTQMFSRTAFVPTSVGEYLLNYDSFRGGAIYPDVKAGVKKTTHESGRAFEKSPNWMKSLVGYAEGEDGQARVNPRIAWMLGEIPTSRFTNVAKKIWDSDDDEAKGFNYNHLASSVFGINKYKYDAEQMQYFVNKGRVDAMTQVLANMRLLKSWDIDRSVFKQEDKRNSYNPLPIAGSGPIKE